MLIVVDTPVLEKRYTPEGTTKEEVYTFNTVGVLDNVYIGVESYQMPLSFINGTTYATIHIMTDYTAELNQIKTEVGEVIVYVYDNYEMGYNYSGRYKLENIIYDGSETTASLYFVDNNGPTFFGVKYFPATTNSQVSYKYRNQITFNVYDYVQLGSQFVDKLITSVTQNMNANGINYINISEIALPYVNSTGSRMIRISATEVDYFGNTSTLQGRPITFIYGSLPEVNYYKYILFNPINEGNILPTTTDKIYYNNERIYPFYINFILQDEGIQENGYTMKIIYRTYILQNGKYIIQNQIQDNISTSRGLNIFDISTTRSLIGLLNKNIAYITIQLMYERGYNMGQFTTQFTDEFVLAGQTETGDIKEYDVKLEFREFNDRRDFYMKYNNGIGGISTILSTNYEESIDPEIISLRNRNVLNNLVVRSTEVMDVTFDQVNQDKLKEILGFEPSYMFKSNGIYESSSITRIGADLSEKEYIIRNATYNKNNQDLYNTVKVELFRPMNSGFQQIGSVDIDMKIETNGGEINLMDDGYYVDGNNICKFGVQMGGVISAEVGEYTLITNCRYVNELDNGFGQIWLTASDMSSFVINKYMIGEEGIKKGIITSNKEGQLLSLAYDSEFVTDAHDCNKKYLTVYWVFVCKGNGSNFKFWTPPLAAQEAAGKTTIQVEMSLNNIENLMITSYGFTIQDGEDFETYEFYDDNYSAKQLVWVKTKGANSIIQSFVRTSQGVRYGKQQIYKS